MKFEWTKQNLTLINYNENKNNVKRREISETKTQWKKITSDRIGCKKQCPRRHSSMKTFQKHSQKKLRPESRVDSENKNCETEWVRMSFGCLLVYKKKWLKFSKENVKCHCTLVSIISDTSCIIGESRKRGKCGRHWEKTSIFRGLHPEILRS